MDAYLGVMDEAGVGLRRFREIVDALPAAAARALAPWYVPASVRAVVSGLVDEAVAAARDVAALIGELLAGAAAPVTLFRLAWRWRDIAGTASDVTATLADQRTDAWAGSASQAYAAATAAQGRASAQLGTVAGGVAANLAECASAAVPFYLALAVVVARLVAAAVTAAAAFGTAVLSLAGIELILTEALGGLATVSALLSTLGVCLAAQARGLVGLHGLAVDHTAYPGGRWPGPHTDSYADATVTDGDADWSLRR